MRLRADRPTLVLEIIQRFGCESEVVRVRDDTGVVERVTVQVCAPLRPASILSNGCTIQEGRYYAACKLPSRGTSIQFENERARLQEAGCGGFGKNNVREIYDLMVRHDTQFRAVESH